jgi:hypothetical protein
LRLARGSQAAPEPEKKEEKTPPNKDDVEKILRDLKIKMPGCEKRSGRGFRNAARCAARGRAPARLRPRLYVLPACRPLHRARHAGEQPPLRLCMRPGSCRG